MTAEDVVRGKPYPDGFRLAAEKLGCDARDCLIFEDAPAGIQAAEASGATVMVVTATHAHPMVTPHATMASFDDLRLSVQEAGCGSSAGSKSRKCDRQALDSIHWIRSILKLLF